MPATDDWRYLRNRPQRLLRISRRAAEIGGVNNLRLGGLSLDAESITVIVCVRSTSYTLDVV